MWRVRYAVKAAIAYVLYGLGILDLWRARALRGRAVVLMYHRVLSDDARAHTGSHPGYVVANATFARHMACVKRRFTVLSERTFVQHLDDQRPFPDSSCLITFDDGWHDNLTHALPALRAHGLPAVVYLPVNFIGTRRRFWREGLTHLLLEAVRRVHADGANRACLEPVLRAQGFEDLLALPDGDPRPAVVEAVQREAHRRVDDGGRGALECALGVDAASLDAVDTFLSWDEVRMMAAEGVSFGAHGVEHRLLAALPAAEADREVRESMRVVAEQLGVPALGFSYPNGSVTPAVRDMVEAAGYRAAFTTEPGTVDVRDDRFMLKRINVHEDMTGSTPMFLARVVGLF